MTIEHQDRQRCVEALHMASPPRSQRELVLGIDFGTSYSSAGILLGKRVNMVLDSGESAIPSIVHLPYRGEPVAGAKALVRLGSDPGSTVPAIKRILGRLANDVVVKRFQQSVPYLIRSSPTGKAVLELATGEYAAEQIAAVIFRRLKDLAEERFGGVVKKAVVCTPVRTAPGFAESLRKAARLAGFSIAQFIAEPVAAALAMGLHLTPQNRTMLVCDFGGGTFDVTLMEQSGLSFRCLAVDGDEFLGGEDFDEALAQGVAGVIHRSSGFDVTRDVVRMHQLRLRCESVKRQLSSREEVPLIFPDAYMSHERQNDLNLQIERTWIAPRWMPLVRRAENVILRLLDTTNVPCKKVDHLVLVGGTNLIPMVREHLSALVPGAKIITGDYIDLAIAAGTVVQTATLRPNDTELPTVDSRLVTRQQ